MSGINFVIGCCGGGDGKVTAWLVLATIRCRTKKKEFLQRSQKKYSNVALDRKRSAWVWVG